VLQKHLAFALDSKQLAVYGGTLSNLEKYNTTMVKTVVDDELLSKV
jgi:hypothetical protein